MTNKQAEPVAWTLSFDHGKTVGTGRAFSSLDDAEEEAAAAARATVMSLFSKPPAAEVQRLREAASALCGALTESELNDRAYHALNALRRALEGK